jgi:poly(3-hydroxybutyrate) depolymerase
MVRRSTASVFARAYERNLKALTKITLGNSKRVASQVQRAAGQRLKPPPGKGDWLSGMALGPGGARGYHLFRPAGLQLKPGEKLPLMVMLHGCGQTGRDFAVSTRMNTLAAREGFLVLYPEQDRRAHRAGLLELVRDPFGHSPTWR